jgi:hypothetical protein
MMNILSIIMLSVGTFLNVSCGSNNNKANIAQAAIDSTITVSKNDKQITDTLPVVKKAINLATVRDIEVMTVEKEIENDNTSEDNGKCKTWSLTAKQIESIIRKFKSMSSEEQYLAYSFYQCRISGEIKIDQVKYRYWIGAGGTLTLKNNDTSLYFGCADKKSEKYFISGELTEKELKE